MKSITPGQKWSILTDKDNMEVKHLVGGGNIGKILLLSFEDNEEEIIKCENMKMYCFCADKWI